MDASTDWFEGIQEVLRQALLASTEWHADAGEFPNLGASVSQCHHPDFVDRADSLTHLSAKTALRWGLRSVTP